MATDDQPAGSRADLQAVLRRLLLAGRTNTTAATRHVEAVDRTLRDALRSRALTGRGAVVADRSRAGGPG
jgi:hypothetical protein